MATDTEATPDKVPNITVPKASSDKGKSARKKANENRVVQSAERRAKLMAFLHSRPEPASIADITKATGIPDHAVAYLTKRMAESKQIVERRIGIANFYSLPGEEDLQSELPLREVQTQTRVKTAKDVELVLAGMLVVIGRNPKTNRIRITLEEV